MDAPLTPLFFCQIFQQTGATVITKGVYVPPGSQPPANEKPLFLRVTAKDKESVDKALDKIKEMMRNKTSMGGGAASGNIERVYLDIDSEEAKSLGFNLCGKILGPKV